MDTSGFDLSPLMRMAMMGLALAAGPLAWVVLRQRGQSAAHRLRAMTLLTLFLTFDLVLFGAFTRLTDSGLGCPDWPGCYGHASPLGANALIAQAQETMPTGPVTHGKAWIEMLHRYMATAVGVLILTLFIARWREQRSGERGVVVLPSLWWPGLTLLAVCLQGAFGALTVTMKLFPAIVTLHLLGSLCLIALLVAQASRYDRCLRKQRVAEVPRLLQSGLVAATVLLVVQISLGGWVSTNYAVLACDTFPACQNSWWPVMDFQQGFTLWRELGLTAAGDNISFAALTAIHYAHRLMAYLVLFVLVLVAAAMLRHEALGKQARSLMALTLLQLLTGLSNVVLDWPLVAALMHTGGAAAMVGVMIWSLSSLRVVPQMTSDFLSPFPEQKAST
jgi:cytochrome c oxidase assembly protein subunit 15